MRSTGTGSDAVFAHADPHSGSCAVLSLDDNVPHRADRGHFTISAETSPPPTVDSFSRPKDELLSSVESFPIAGEFHYSPSRILGVAQSAPVKRLPITPDTLRQRCARMRHRRPLAAYRFSPDIRHRQPYILGARHADEAERTTISLEVTSKTRHHTISMSRTAIPPNKGSAGSSDEHRRRGQSGRRRFDICPRTSAAPNRRPKRSRQPVPATNSSHDTATRDRAPAVFCVRVPRQLNPVPPRSHAIGITEKPLSLHQLANTKSPTTYKATCCE